MKPLVIESYRRKRYEGIVYRRRLRISPFNAALIDEQLGTTFYYSTKYIVLDEEMTRIVCRVLEVEYKEVPTYLCIDGKMGSLKVGKK